MLQTNSTGEWSQCLSHAGPAPAHGAHSSGSRLLSREPSEASPRLHAPPRSKPLRLGTQIALRGANLLSLCFVPFPGPSSSGVWRAWSLQLVAFPVPAAQFSGCTLAFLLRWMVTVFEDNDLLFWVPDVLCQHSDVVCGIYSALKCSFNEFVGEKVVSLSHSSTIF